MDMELLIQTLLLAATVAATLWTLLKFMLRDIHKDLININTQITEIKSNMKKQESRIDHLYQICIELLQTRK